MRYVFIFCFFFCWQVCLGQFNRFNFKYARGHKPITLLAFERQRAGRDTDVDEIRRIPYDMGNKFPFYISLGSWNRKFVHYEFFRIDTTRYFAREYFRGNFPQGETVKSFGEEVVDKKVSDSVLVDLFDPVCADKIPFFLAAELRLIKDGLWTEFENCDLSPSFWRGSYLNNRKTGVWNRMLSFDEDTLLLSKIDYGKDSTKIYGENGIREKTLWDLKQLLPGERSWSSFDYNADGIIRSIKNNGDPDYAKSTCYLSDDQYFFNKSGEFVKRRPQNFPDGGKVLDSGSWRLYWRGDKTFMDMAFNDGKKWELELLYYSEKEGLFMNLTRHTGVKTQKKKSAIRKTSFQKSLQ